MTVSTKNIIETIYNGGSSNAMPYHSYDFDIGLILLVSNANTAMLEKLAEKYEEGYYGWSNINLAQQIWTQLEDHVAKGPDKDNMVDIMNLAAMLWNMAGALHLVKPIIVREFKENTEV